MQDDELKNSLYPLIMRSYLIPLNICSIKHKSQALRDVLLKPFLLEPLIPYEKDEVN